MKELIKHYQMTFGRDNANLMKLYSAFLKNQDYTDAEKAEVSLIGCHQSRLNDIKCQQDSREIAIAKLTEAKLWQNDYHDFADIYSDVQKLIKPIDYIGDLTVYDVSLRISTVSEEYPKDLYLNAGAFEGAVNLLGNKYKVPHVMLRSEFVKIIPEFTLLSSMDIENVLCIYKAVFAKHIVKKGAPYPNYNPTKEMVCGIRRNMLAHKLLFPSIH